MPARAQRAQDLRTGLPLNSFASDGSPVDKEIDLLVRRLARRGLLEYRLGHAGDDQDQVVIEPQVPDYWPRTPKLGDADMIVLSRFAYLRRRGNEMVLESPRAGALFRICDPKVAAALALLSTPQQIKRFRRQDGFPGRELLALLVDCQILFKIDAASGDGLRAAEGDDNLVLWDFHDLLFHTHSTEGRQANPLGGLYPYAGVIAPPPAVRPRWPGKKIDLRKLSAAPSQVVSPLAKLLRERHSTRDFDDRQPITLAELAQFLDQHRACPVEMEKQARAWRRRSGGRVYREAVSVGRQRLRTRALSGRRQLRRSCTRILSLRRRPARAGADRRARRRSSTRSWRQPNSPWTRPATPQILITIAARFDRISWKYSSIAYSLILKDVGVLIQTLYLMATDMGLGGCAIGISNIDLFAKMTGIEFHIEGPVGQFALGRGSQPEISE